MQDQTGNQRPSAAPGPAGQPWRPRAAAGKARPRSAATWRLVSVGFLALMAGGMGFAVRACLLGSWAEMFGFTKVELGIIAGGGLVGAGIGLLGFSVRALRAAPRPLLLGAAGLQLLSVVVTLLARTVFYAQGRTAAGWCLFAGVFLFCLGIGMVEAVVHPMVPAAPHRDRARRFNVLHAAWPLGMVFGAGVCWELVGRNWHQVPLLNRWLPALWRDPVPWEVSLLLCLLPVLLHLAFMLFMAPGRVPPPAPPPAGTTMGAAWRDLAAPGLLVLLVLMMLAGSLQLGVDGWLANMAATVADNPQRGVQVLLCVSAVTLLLRILVTAAAFREIPPLEFLVVSACVAAFGLFKLSTAGSAEAFVQAAIIYAVGRTFLWPATLAVAAGHHTRGGALTLNLMSGGALLAAGLIGVPVLGLGWDHQAAKRLKENAPEVAGRYVVEETPWFPLCPRAGLDGTRVAAANTDGEPISRNVLVLRKSGRPFQSQSTIRRQAEWWSIASGTAEKDYKKVLDASGRGLRVTLKWWIPLPVVMALLYFGLRIYLRRRLLYRGLYIDGKQASGGVAGPVE
ncbi:MAG: hypothetical protein FJ388_13280 [Verrucomicrobia bacterium]|nr:hypothetical protein [Verrucomicrobiota bacterium]